MPCIDKKGHPPQFPSLENIKDRFTREQIYEQIEKGKNQMPSFSFLAKEQKETIIDFIIGDSTQKRLVLSRNLTPEEKGKMIFQANCSSCHQATVNDPVPAGNKMCMMRPEALAGTTKRFSKQEFISILENGPCYMPSFSHFTEEEINNLWTYLKTLEGKGEPERPTMGEMCPMIKQMREGKSRRMMKCPMMSK